LAVSTQDTFGQAAPPFLAEFRPAWQSSEKYTLTIFEQMPEDKLDWRYTPEAFSFRTQFVHCITFTASQLAGRLGVANPYETRGDWDKLSKQQLSVEIKQFYGWVLQTLTKVSPAKLRQKELFGGDEIPIWRVFYALENHIIHHRGQAICYLRLNGITPEGFVGWW
jgi:hypothetical protein